MEMAIKKLKRHKSPDIDQMSAKLIKGGGKTIQSEIHKPINSVWIMEELPEQLEESIIVPVYKIVIK
jgi:hypothetical protein